MSASQNLPLVSVLTPSFNSATFIGETIQSVLLQDYPNIEHIIVDGGSTDDTVEILRKYPHLKWVSEPDQGQSDALNKAFAMSKGEIIGWVNADDLYEAGVIKKVVNYFLTNPKATIVYGNCTVFGPKGETLEYWHTPYNHQKLLEPWRGFHGAYQPAIFYRREVLDRIGHWAVDLHYAMDYDILLRASEFYTFDYLDADIARFRRHTQQKGTHPWHKFVREFMVSVERFWHSRNLCRYWYYRFQVRYFYALALLEQITTDELNDPSKASTYLWQALRVAPSILRYRWIRRRCLHQLLGDRLSTTIQTVIKNYRKA